MASVTLAWDYPAEEHTADITFRIYSTTDASLPPADWPLLTTTKNLSVDVPMVPGKRLFYATAYSDFWQVESNPSEAVSTPALPVNGLQLRISRTAQQP